MFYWLWDFWKHQRKELFCIFNGEERGWGSLKNDFEKWNYVPAFSSRIQHLSVFFSIFRQISFDDFWEFDVRSVYCSLSW